MILCAHRKQTNKKVICVDDDLLADSDNVQWNFCAFNEQRLPQLLFFSNSLWVLQ